MKPYQLACLTILGTFLLTCFTFFSCESDYLNRRPETVGYDFDGVYTDSANYWKYCSYLVVNPLFLHLQNGANPYGSWDDIGDNSMSTRYSGNIPCVNAQQGDYYGLATNGAAKMCNDETWTNMWRHLRIANTGLQNIEHYSGSDFTKKKILGLCYFYRGYVYMELTRRWGGMPYLTRPLLSTENMDLPRLSMQETYENAALDFDSAAYYLRDWIPDDEFQYPTRIAALAMKSRCLLYAASDQARLEEHPTNPGKDLWAKAAEAADEALKAAEDVMVDGSNYYGLVEWGASLNGDDGYYYVFKGNDPRRLTKEVLFGRRARINWSSNTYKECGRPPGQLDGTLGVGVNQLLVDCFEMQATGLPIEEPGSGYVEQNPYVGRDPRFYHDIMFNGSKIMGRTLQIWNYDEATGISGSMDCAMSGNNATQGYTPTGTYARKWMGLNYGENNFHQCWPYIRLAEVYLNFAEAANEAWGNPDVTSGSSKYSAAEALNMVRNRALMPDIDSRFLVSKEAFRARVRNERRVELCFEEHRLFDVRRWLIGKEPLNRDIWKVRITKLAPGYNANTYPTGFKFERSVHVTRPYEDKHNLFVITRNDTRLGPNFKQNPGW